MAKAINIAFVLLDQMLATSMTWPNEMMHAAQQYHLSQFKKSQQLKIDFVSEKECIHSQSGLPLYRSKSLGQQTYNYIYIPALWRNPQKIVSQSEPLLNWLYHQHQQGAYLSAVGTGCCLLASAGLLDYKPATTHWFYFDEFAQLYPNVELKRQHFITEANHCFCTASINSLADLTIHHIENIFNKETAQHIERHFSHEIRQSYESHGYFEYQDNIHPDELISQAQSWLQENFAEEIKLADIAEKFALSERQIVRRFKLATGKTPAMYLQYIRINAAMDLLQATNLSIQDIASRVGLADKSYFAAVFKKTLSVSPSEYRKTVRAKLFSYN